MPITKFLARDIFVGIAYSTVGGNVTGVAGTDIITTATAHGFTAGTPVVFPTLTGGAGLASTPTVYWVIAASLTATTFKVSATQGGSALDFTTDITAGTVETFTLIGGVNSVAHAPSTSDATTTDFRSAGHAEHMVAERGDEWTLSGFLIEDVSAGTRDAGQAAVHALAKAIGLSSIGLFQIRSPGGNAITFQASAEVTLHSGGNNDAATWQAKLSVTGAPAYTP
jgi:hypothetical protein